MRGTDQQQNHVFSYISPEQRVRKDHPLRPIRTMVDDILKQLSPPSYTTMLDLLKQVRRDEWLRQIHGDFHPWNILFRPGIDFQLLDRSRGEYGDPADDLTSLTVNYFFFSLQRSGRLEDPLEAERFDSRENRLE